MDNSAASNTPPPFFITTRLLILAVVFIIILILASFAMSYALSQNNTGAQLASVTAKLTDAIPITSAWGTQAKVTEISGKIDSNHIFVLQSITPDGKALLGTIYPADMKSEAGRLVLLDIQSRQITEIHTLPQPSFRVHSADTDGDWIGWLEVSYLEPYVYSWNLYAYNTHTRKVKLLDGEPAPSLCEGCGTDTYMAALTHGTLIWYKLSYGSRPPSTSYFVQSTDLATGTTTHLTNVNGLPLVSWPYIAAHQVTRHLERLNAGLPENPDNTLNVQNMLTDSYEAFPMAQNETLVAAHNDTLVWRNPTGDIYLTNHQKSQSQPILQVPELIPTQINSRLITLMYTYPNENQLIAWDLVQQRLVRISDYTEKPIKSLLKNNNLVWTSGFAYRTNEEGEPVTNSSAPLSQTIYILNTAGLPTAGSTP